MGRKRKAGRDNDPEYKIASDTNFSRKKMKNSD